jgi:protein-disulfide isomerase
MSRTMSTNNDAGVATGRRLLAGAVALGLVNSLWSLLEWAELLLVRQGGKPFCSVDEKLNCAQVWDGAFAVAVHDVTQIPIAGWGLAWGIVATLLPLLALTEGALLQRGVSSAIRIVALVGVASIPVFAGASAMAGALCTMCIGTYVFVAGWATCAWLGTRRTGFASAGAGAVLAGALTLACLLALLVPGMRTPHATGKLDLAAAKEGASSPSSSPSSSASPSKAPTSTTGSEGMFAGPATGDPVRDDLLQRFMGSLDEQTRQAMSDLLAAYRAASPGVLGAPRSLVIGDAKAPVRLTDWTDPQCPHCAMLHETLAEIARTVPPNLFSVEPRHFPLDGFCNPEVQRRSEDGARCIGALAQICLEGDPRQFEASGALFAARAATVDAVYAALKPFVDPAKLKACVEGDDAKKKLADDIAAAMQFKLEGTPLVLLNGREVRAFPPLIYALLLTGGADRHPAFAGLPAPRPLDDHGHAH